MEQQKEKLLKQLIDLHGRTIYTSTAHHEIQNRKERWFNIITIIQIVLTAISTGGFLATIITNQYLLAWIGGAASAITLGLNLYMKDNNIEEAMLNHKAAADELWDVREKFASLIADIDDLSIEEIRNNRDQIVAKWGEINKKYYGTDKKGYEKAKEDLQKKQVQSFEKGEAEKFLPFD